MNESFNVSMKRYIAYNPSPIVSCRGKQDNRGVVEQDATNEIHALTQATISWFESCSTLPLLPYSSRQGTEPLHEVKYVFYRVVSVNYLL